MGLFGQIMGSAVEKLTKDKEQREREKAYVRNNEGSKAICAYMAHLFQKGNAGYDWVKENRVGLFPVIHDSYVLCAICSRGMVSLLQESGQRTLRLRSIHFRKCIAGMVSVKVWVTPVCQPGQKWTN